MKWLVALLAAAAFVTAAPAALGDDYTEVACWNCMFENGDPFDGFIDPNEDPYAGGVAGGVRGGDGATCSYAAVLAGCTPDDIALNPCMGYECDGDEGTGEVCYNDFWIIICRKLSAVGGGNQSFVEGPPPEPHDTEYVRCPGADDPGYDPNNPDCY